MGVNIKNENDIFTTGAETGNTNKAENTTNTTGASMDPLSLRLGLFAGDGSSTGYLKDFIEAAKEHLQPMKIGNNDVKFHMYRIDRNSPQFSRLDYSFVVYALTASNTDKVFYYVTELEATGRYEPGTVSQKLEAVVTRQIPFIFVASDAIDQVVINTVTNVITQDLNVSDDKLVNVKGLVVPYDIPATEAGIKATVLAKKHLVAEYMLRTKQLSILNISALNGTREEPRIPKLDTTYLQQPSQDQIGKVVRGDFKLDLRLESPRNQQQIYGLNSAGEVIPVSSQLGYIEFVLAPREIPGMVQMPGTQQLIGKPLVITNVNDGISPTVDIALLNIVNSTIFVDRRHLIPLLLNYPKDFGVLNYLINTENNKNGHGAKLKLKSGKYTQEQIVEYMMKLVDLNPHICVEIDIYGPNFNPESPFAALHLVGKQNKLAQSANDYIVKIAEAMVGSEIKNRQVAANEGIIVPTGYWIDKNGVKRDIREIDLPFILENTNDMVLINKWLVSNAPMSVTGQDPFVLKLEVLNALIPNAVLEGKAVRITLNPMFITEFTNAVSAAGYSPKTDIGLQFTDIATDMFKITNVFAGGVSNIHLGAAGYQAPAVSTLGLNLYGQW